MKKSLSLLAALALSAGAYAQTWTLDKAHSSLGFSITHLTVSEVDGSFKDFDAAIQSNKPDFSDATFTLTAQATSINTDNEKRDEHLRSPDYFDVASHPTVSFKSRKLQKAGKDQYKVLGDLTMHGVTKPVVLNVSFRGPAVHPMSKKTFAGFKATGTVKRSDFNIAPGTGAAILGDEVNIVANGEFVKS